MQVPFHKRLRIFLSFCLLFIINTTAHAQLYEKEAFAHFNMPEAIKNDEIGVPEPFKMVIYHLDSLAKSDEKSKYFAEIFKRVINNVSVQIYEMDSGTKRFISKFVLSFYKSFYKACVEFDNGNISSNMIWNTYFSHNTGISSQMALIGINAHVNGDMWKALADNFNENEIKEYRKNFMWFQRSSMKSFEYLFDNLKTQNRFMNLFHKCTFGADKYVSNKYLYKWRCRQVRLAILYYNNSKKFNKLLLFVKKKKENIDRLLLFQLQNSIIWTSN